MNEPGSQLPPSADELFRLLIDSVADYALISFNPEGTIVGWNRGGERVLGYKQDEILGQPCSVIFTPEDREKGAPEFEMEQARTEGRSEDERWHLRKDGSRFWSSGVLTAIRDGSGLIVGFGKVLRDLTERKIAEDRLRYSEERLRLFIENVTEAALFQLDPERRISGWNRGAAKLFQYSESEVLGKSVDLLFLPADTGRAHKELDIALAGGRAEDEGWVVRKDGSRFYGRWITNIMLDSEGKLRGFVKILRDETARKLAEEDRISRETQEKRNLEANLQSAGEALDRTKEELRALANNLLAAAEDERRRIARDLHDDLAQRLAMLEVNLTHLAQSGMLADRIPVQNKLKTLQQSVSQLSEEVRRLSHRLHPSILDDLGLEVALRTLTEDFGRSRPQAVNFETADVSEVPPQIAGVLYRIAQEALRNVSKHGGVDPVYVKLSLNAGRVQLTVRDEGPGFNPAAARGRGGLGIISMKERAHLVGGSVEIASSPGKGTSVEVTIPLEGSIVRHNVPEDSQKERSVEDRVRVVIADDDHETQQVLRGIVEPHCLVIGVADNGRTAAELAERHRPDLVLLDISMPGATGLEVSRRLRNSAPETRIIIVTAHNERSYADEAFRIGASGFVAKQDLRNELRAALSAVIDGGTYVSPRVH